jgi:hypothetical protein
MNQRIEELVLRAEEYADGYDDRAGIAWFQFYNEKFAELIVKEYANNLVQANMSNPEYARAMDAYYEQKWAHRFD